VDKLWIFLLKYWSALGDWIDLRCVSEKSGILLQVAKDKADSKVRLLYRLISDKVSRARHDHILFVLVSRLISFLLYLLIRSAFKLCLVLYAEQPLKPLIVMVQCLFILGVAILAVI